jgi:DNA repair exonuclease SbcCD nuclease subunit
MGHDPVKIQMLSENSSSSSSSAGNNNSNSNFLFRNLNGSVNYEDECYSVDMPIFCIHGNHDDPTRDGGELLAALDLLAMSNLVNYFGTYLDCVLRIMYTSIYDRMPSLTKKRKSTTPFLFCKYLSFL